MRLDVECGRRGDREGEEEARRELHDVERPDELLQLRRRVDDRRDDAREHHRRVADRRGGRAAIGSDRDEDEDEGGIGMVEGTQPHHLLP